MLQTRPSHTHSHERLADRRTLVLALLITGGFMIVEVVGGLIAGSLALLADAGHMLTDVTALGLALGAIWLGARAPSHRHTFGFRRSEVMAALANVLGLWIITGWIAFEAIGRIQTPPEVQAPVMLAIGGAGLAFNLLVAVILFRPAGHSLNIQAAFLHVLGDLLGSIGVLMAGLLIILFGWSLADPLLALFVGSLILVSSLRLLKNTLHMIMQGAPTHLDVVKLCRYLEQVPGVTGVHDLHAWTLTSGYDVFSAHVTTCVSTTQGRDSILKQLRGRAREYGFSHITIQLEYEDGECAEELHHSPHA